MNPLIQGHSRTAPETSRNAYGTNQGTNEDDSQSDPHPEAGVFQSQTTRNSGPEEGHDINHFLNTTWSQSGTLDKAVTEQNNFYCTVKRFRTELFSELLDSIAGEHFFKTIRNNLQRRSIRSR